MTDRSALAVATLAEVDPQFSELCELLYGPAVDPRAVWADVFGKANPDQTDVHVPGDSLKRRAALAATVVGGALGAKELGEQGPKALRALRSTRGRGLLVRSRPGLTGVRPGPVTRVAGVGAMFGGDLLAADELKRKRVAKAGLNKLVRGNLTQHRRLVRAALESSKPPGRQPARYVPSEKAKVDKRVSADWAGEFSKLDSDKRLALGWANICKVNGVPVVDRQNDYIDAEDLEDAVYAYVERSRIGGDMHDRAVGKSNGRGLWFGLYSPQLDEPRHVADLVESVIITKAKKQAMGLPAEFPEGWWVGFRYHDDEVWESIKKGERTGFSIHGRGLRSAVDYDQLMAAGL